MIQSSENDLLIKTAFKGLTYLVIRFQKINFDIIAEIFKKLINDEDAHTTYLIGLLYDIAVVIPSLRERCLELLKPFPEHYIEELKWDWQK